MDPSFLPATRLAELTRTRAIGCLELLDHFIARTERLNPRINAVIVSDFDRARQRARRLDSASDRSAPLFGVPMTVKESFDVAGLPTTRGHVSAKSHQAPRTGLPVRRLQAAGAIVLGKTNVPVSLADWQSYNPVYGSTSNPWDLSRTPGGSSGGSAAVMATGLAGLELGSDIGGSIRVPAHFCGVFGHKPTWSLCPNSTIASTGDISVLGPLARSATDLAVALDVLAGPDPDESEHRILLPPPRFAQLAELRVALWAEQPGQATDRETVAALDRLASALEQGGATVSRTARPDFDPTEAYHLYLRLLNAAWSMLATEADLVRQREAVARRGPADMSADAIMIRGVDVTHREWLHLNERRYQIRRAWSAFFRQHDVLLCPAFATAALPHMQNGETWERRITVDGREMAYNDLLFWPGITGGFHLPATIAPIGLTQGGLPTGVQIAGPVYGDRTTLAAAALLEREYYSFTPPPGWD